MSLESPPTVNPDSKGDETLFTRNAADLPPGMLGVDTSAGSGLSEGIEDADTIIREKARRDSWLIQRALTIYTNSTTYMDSNITNTWAKNIAYFRNEHAPGSVLRGGSFKRSRVFRPKTRTNVKAQEAALTTALFSTQEQVAIEAQNPTDLRQVASAQVNKVIMEYRLKNTIKWFMTSVGAYQDTKVYGVCISHQYWDYAEDEDVLPAKDESGAPVMGDDGNGKQVPMGTSKKVVRRDKPCIDLLPPENFCFDPMCDWRDPAQTSPYIVMQMPIYIDDAKEMMTKVDPKTGQPPWRQYSMSQMMSTRRRGFDRTRQAREGQSRIDPTQSHDDGVYTTVWAHLNILRIGGEDIAYWTMGTELLLTDPIKLTEMYPHLREGERPFQIGYSTIEAHRNYPAGDVEQSGGLQEEINKIANQRLDNVDLVLNKRYFVRRGSMTDLDALIRNTPGGGVMMNDPEKDVKVLSTDDVTSSAYQEQDRMSSEFDSLVGNFSPAAPQNNEKQTPALGVAKMGGQSAGAVQDYSIRVFIETWVDPVLRQLQRMIACYETDEVILGLAGAKAKDAMLRFGTDQITDDLLRQDLMVGVNVGIGNTDPQTRVQKIVYGVSQVIGIPGMAARIKPEQVSNEIFGALGYRDGSRFFMNDQEAQQAQAGKQPEIPPEVQVKMKELEIREADNKARDTREQARLEADIELGYAKLAVEKGVKLEALYTNLGIAAQKDRTHRDVAALNAIGKHQDHQVKRFAAVTKAAEPPKPSTPPAKAP